MSSYILQQRVQPFLTTRPLSSQLKLTPREMQAILARDKSVMDPGHSLGGSTARKCSRGRAEGSGTSPAGDAEVAASPAALSGPSAPARRVRQRVVYLTRAASARTVTKSLNVVIDFNLLVRGCVLVIPCGALFSVSVTHCVPCVPCVP